MEFSLSFDYLQNRILRSNKNFQQIEMWLTLDYTEHL